MNRRFTIEALPIAAARPRTRVVNGRAMIYTLKGGKYGAWFKALVSAFTGGAHFTGPIEVSIAFALPRRKSEIAAAGGLRPSAREHHVTRPDVDNLAKGVLDAMTAAGLINDDRQVVRLVVEKFYANGLEGGAVVKVRDV